MHVWSARGSEFLARSNTYGLHERTLDKKKNLMIDDISSLGKFTKEKKKSSFDKHSQIAIYTAVSTIQQPFRYISTAGPLGLILTHSSRPSPVISGIALSRGFNCAGKGSPSLMEALRCRLDVAPSPSARIVGRWQLQPAATIIYQGYPRVQTQLLAIQIHRSGRVDSRS